MGIVKNFLEFFVCDVQVKILFEELCVKKVANAVFYFTLYLLVFVERLSFVGWLFVGLALFAL